MSNSFHGEPILPAERPIDKPYPNGEPFELVQSWIRGQADAHRALATTFANNDYERNAYFEWGYAAGLSMAAAVHDNVEHRGEKR